MQSILFYRRANIWKCKINFHKFLQNFIEKLKYSLDTFKLQFFFLFLRDTRKVRKSHYSFPRILALQSSILYCIWSLIDVMQNEDTQKDIR